MLLKSLVHVPFDAVWLSTDAKTHIAVSQKDIVSAELDTSTLTVGDIQLSIPPEGYQTYHGDGRENDTSPRTDLEGKLFARIKEDLEPWRNGISREMVEHTYCTVSLPSAQCLKSA